MRKIAPLLLLALALASCMQVNTMYNARKYFASAQARPLSANGRPNNQAVEEYTKAIKKCGIILSNEKQGKLTDDALFLMAKSLYYKGNSAFQARDQFESLIRGFPDSPFFGEAHIYLARVLRDINLQEQASKVLQEFILNPQHKKLHPRALLTLAEFNITDKDYLQAQYWLGRIISDYPKSSEYREAFYIYGQNYFIQKDYRAALAEFQKIAKDRRIPQTVKLDARYYMALNQYMLGEYDQSRKTIQRLLKDELRPEKLSQARVLMARLMLASGETEKGLVEIEEIGKLYPRTPSSAEGQYYLGEYYFYQARDLEKAGAAYGKVRTESQNSALAEPAQQKATAVTQLKSKLTFNPESNLQQYVDYHISAAENYFTVFALPDSALVMYQRVIDSRDSLVTLKATLEVERIVSQGVVDSLTIALAALPEPVLPDSLEAPEDSLEEIPDEADSLATADSLGVLDIQLEEKAAIDSLEQPEIETDIAAEPDSLDGPELQPEVEAAAESLEAPQVEPDIETEPDILDVPELQLEEKAAADSLEQPEIETDIAAEPDSLETPDLEPAHEALADSLGTFDISEDIPASADSLAAEMIEEEPEPDPEVLRQSLTQQLTGAESQLERLAKRLETVNGLLLRYDRELIPLALFSQASVYSKSGPDRTQMEAIFARMSEDHPSNKYTNALEDMLAGNPVRLIDPEEEAQELLLDRAFGLAEAEPDSMLVILNELKDSQYLPISLKANYRLGWYHTFEAADTTAAKPYLNKVLELERSGEYGSVTSRFFDGSKFQLNKFDAIIDSLAIADSLAALADSAAVADSLGTDDRPASEEGSKPETGDNDDLQPQVVDEAESETVPPPEAVPDAPTPEETKPQEPLPDDPAPDETPPDEDLPGDEGNSPPLSPDVPTE